MIEYILLILTFILPVWYRYFFWFSHFENKKNIIIWRDKDNIFHIFTIIEIFLFILSLWIFIQAPFEFIVFNLMFYYWILSSIFVLWKLLRWKLKNKIRNKNKYYFYFILIFSLFFISIWNILYWEEFKYIYNYLLWIIIFSPLLCFIIIKIFFRKIIMKKVVILTGWTWLERWIALKSSEFFKNYIDREYDVFDLPNQMSDFLKHKDEYEFAIPVFHWEYWEDGRIFALLDSLNIPHTFSNYKTHALCLDKEKANTLVFQLWITLPFQYIAETSESFPESYPVIMKPNQWGSSFHTYKINNNQEFYDSFNKTKKDISDDILIQEFIYWEEYSVSIVDWQVLPIMKLEKEEWEFFDYDAKYISDDLIKETFPELEVNLVNELKRQSLLAYNYFDLKSMARVEFIVKDWELYFLEVNTIPWMTEESILPKAWNLTWKTNKELVKIITNIK